MVVLISGYDYNLVKKWDKTNEACYDCSAVDFSSPAEFSVLDTFYSFFTHPLTIVLSIRDMLRSCCSKKRTKKRSFLLRGVF
jgi:hypothetical protein